MSQWKSGLQLESDTICMGEIEEMPRGKNKRRSCVGKGKQEHDEGESMNVKAEECGTSRKDEVNQDSSNDHANDSNDHFEKGKAVKATGEEEIVIEYSNQNPVSLCLPNVVTSGTIITSNGETAVAPQVISAVQANVVPILLTVEHRNPERPIVVGLEDGVGITDLRPLKAALDDMQVTLNKSQTKVGTLEATIQLLKVDLRKAEEERRKLQSDIEELKTENERLWNENSTLLREQLPQRDPSIIREMHDVGTQTKIYTVAPKPSWPALDSLSVQDKYIVCLPPKVAPQRNLSRPHYFGEDQCSIGWHRRMEAQMNRMVLAHEEELERLKKGFAKKAEKSIEMMRTPKSSNILSIGRHGRLFRIKSVMALIEREIGVCVDWETRQRALNMMLATLARKLGADEIVRQAKRVPERGCIPMDNEILMNKRRRTMHEVDVLHESGDTSVSQGVAEESDEQIIHVDDDDEVERAAAHLESDDDMRDEVAYEEVVEADTVDSDENITYRDYVEDDDVCYDRWGRRIYPANLVMTEHSIGTGKSPSGVSLTRIPREQVSTYGVCSSTERLNSLRSLSAKTDFEEEKGQIPRSFGYGGQMRVVWPKQ